MRLAGRLSYPPIQVLVDPAPRRGTAAQDVATSWNYIVFPPKGVSSARISYYEMVDKIEKHIADGASRSSSQNAVIACVKLKKLHTGSFACGRGCRDSRKAEERAPGMQ